MRKGFFFAGLLFLLISCAPPVLRPPGSAVAPRARHVTYPPSRNVQLYEEGKAAFQEEKTIVALDKLDRFVKLNPSSDLTDDALFLMGQIYLKRDNPYEALRYFQKIERNFPGSNTVEEAVYGQAYCWYRLKDLKRSEETLRRLFAFSPLPDPVYIRAETLKGHLCVLKGEIDCAVSAYLAAKAKTTNPTEQAVLDGFIEKVVFEIRDPEILRGLMEAHSGDIAGDAARVRLAEVLTLKKDFKGARGLLPASFLQRLSGALQQKVADILTRLHRAFMKKVVIGCLLPLSGPRAPFGLRALKGALLAVKAFEPNPKDIDITLLVRDTKGKADVAGKMAKDLVENGHAQAIIGPMFLDTTRAAADQLRTSPVPLISLSQADGVPDLGSFVFRNCLTPEQQVQTLVGFLVHTLKDRTAAILYPQNAFGMRYMKLFWDAFEKMGGEIRGAESYLPTDTDFGVPIKKLVGLYYTKERWERGDTPDEKGKFPPVIDFKVLFIPDIYSRVVLIAPQLAFYDVEGVTLAGVNTWHAPELLKEGRQYVRGAVFTDGFFPGSDLPAIQKFVGDFKAFYDETPEILAAQAFDATRFLVRSFKRASLDEPEALEKALETDTGYHGVSGLRYFSESGEAIRDVLVLTVTRHRFMPVPVRPSQSPPSP